MVIKTYESKSKGFTIEVDNDKCTGVGECVTVCPVEVFELIEGKAVPIKIDECVECCQCVDACPVGAIKHSAC